MGKYFNPDARLIGALNPCARGGIAGGVLITYNHWHVRNNVLLTNNLIVTNEGDGRIRLGINRGTEADTFKRVDGVGRLMGINPREGKRYRQQEYENPGTHRNKPNGKIIKT